MARRTTTPRAPRAENERTETNGVEVRGRSDWRGELDFLQDFEDSRRVGRTAPPTPRGTHQDRSAARAAHPIKEAQATSQGMRAV
jgi:hypothetical protein